MDSRKPAPVGARSLLLLLASLVVPGTVAAQKSPRITQAIFDDSVAVTPEINTEQLEQILAEGRIPVLDVRSQQEYAIAHIPGSRNFYEKEVELVTQGFPDTSAKLVLYCNGPYCGKSRRLSEELIKRGYTGVMRYQLGMPVWRALGNTVQTDLAGIRYILAGDHTAVMVDARSPVAFAKGTLPHAVNIRRGDVVAANEDGRLPSKDKGTRVVVFADTPEDAKAVAEEIARKAYWNSSYFGGTYADLAALAGR
jgi:rhodanese-related sulfurtransferase